MFFSWSSIDFLLDFGNKCVCNGIDVSAFRYILSYEFICVFDGSFLP